MLTDSLVKKKFAIVIPAEQSVLLILIPVRPTDGSAGSVGQPTGTHNGAPPDPLRSLPQEFGYRVREPLR